MVLRSRGCRGWAGRIAAGPEGSGLGSFSQRHPEQAPQKFQAGASDVVPRPDMAESAGLFPGRKRRGWRFPRAFSVWIHRLFDRTGRFRVPSTPKKQDVFKWNCFQVRSGHGRLFPRAARGWNGLPDGLQLVARAWKPVTSSNLGRWRRLGGLLMPRPTGQGRLCAWSRMLCGSSSATSI